MKSLFTAVFFCVIASAVNASTLSCMDGYQDINVFSVNLDNNAVGIIAQVQAYTSSIQRLQHLLPAVQQDHFYEMRIEQALSQNTNGYCTYDSTKALADCSLFQVFGPTAFQVRDLTTGAAPVSIELSAIQLAVNNQTIEGISGVTTGKQIAFSLFTQNGAEADFSANYSISPQAQCSIK